MMALAGSIIVSSILSTALEPAIREIKYRLNTVMKNEMLSVADLVNMRYRNLITDQEYIEYMAKHGFSEDFAKKIFDSSSELITIADIIALKRRNLITENEYKSLLMARGVKDEMIPIFEKATLASPSINDIIRFAVREAYSPQVVEKFGLDEDLPQKYLEEAKKAGLDEESARLYWRAHWELPSISMGFEMFHRGIINREELELLMRTLDIMPFWREKLIQLSYNLPTRVDLRRMFRIGVVDEKYVYDTYRKLGYDEDTARNLTLFTIKTEVEDERQLSKSEILNAYEEQEISRDTAKEYLKRIGYSESASELLILTKEHEISKKLINEEIKSIEDRYVAGEISDEDMQDLINRLDISSARKVREINRIRGVKKKQYKLLSLNEYLNLYKAKAIDEDTLYNRLKALNLLEEDIEAIFKSLGINLEKGG